MKIEIYYSKNTNFDKEERKVSTTSNLSKFKEDHYNYKNLILL